MPPVSNGDHRRSRQSERDEALASAAQRVRDQQELVYRRDRAEREQRERNQRAWDARIAAQAALYETQGRLADPYQNLAAYSYVSNTGRNYPVVQTSPSVPDAWETLQRLIGRNPTPTPVDPMYTPINTIREKVAIAIANDTEAHWAQRTERYREEHRRMADRALRVVPVPGAREEQP